MGCARARSNHPPIGHQDRSPSARHLLEPVEANGVTFNFILHPYLHSKRASKSQVVRHWNVAKPRNMFWIPPAVRTSPQFRDAPFPAVRDPFDDLRPQGPPVRICTLGGVSSNFPEDVFAIAPLFAANLGIWGLLWHRRLRLFAGDIT